MNIKLILSFVLVMTLLRANAQNDCNNYLDRAKNAYYQGRFNDAIATLKSCSVSDSNEVNKWKVSRLLCQCYLGLNDAVAAKMAAEDMLEKNPLYKASLIEDSKEFVKLIGGVNVVPRFSLSLSLAVGLNISYPFIRNSYTISEYTKKYQNGRANQGGLFAGYNLNRRISLHAGVIYAANNYSLDYTLQPWNITYKESLNYLQAHLFARCELKSKGKFKVFVQAGGWSGFLLQSKYSIYPDSGDVHVSELKNIDNTDVRKSNVYGILGGAGISYKLGEGHVFGEVNFQKCFSTINVPDKRLDNQNLIFNYFYIDDDLSINNFTFSLGYTFYLNYFVVHSKPKK